MAQHLLIVVLMYSFSEMKAQALLPPKLTVTPAVITETETVMLNCQTPPSLSLSQCYFRTERGKPVKSFSCLKTLTGTELLEMTRQNSPAQVKVTCFYLYVSESPESDMSSIIIRTSLPPTLTVYPAVINDTDSVTLNCQTPSTVSVSQCYFYTLSGKAARELPCLKTLTATELLKTAHLSSPAEVQLTCFYNVMVGGFYYPSPHSGTSSITIHSHKPKMSGEYFPGDSVVFVCILPGFANENTRCNLYFGEATHPELTRKTMKKMNSKNQWFCHFTLKMNELLRSLRTVQQSDASCDYSLGSDPNSLSPRSDRYSLTDIVEKEPHVTPAMPTLMMTTDLTVSSPRAFTTGPPVTLGWTVTTPHSTGSFSTSAKTESDTSMTLMTPESSDGTTGSSVSTTDAATPQRIALAETIWRSVAVVTGCGIIMGVILLVSAVLCNKKRTGPVGVKRQEPQKETNDLYHLYSTIAEEPAASDLKGVTYSTVQSH
ncbi:uncharacterized protein LOC121952328 isoform X3 [Plectropomus leopardus]|uniref:uncharacterized protein LOC121952328 isoform X3 n=1 Tax=Plectropomus leopardus TaxID=160734 RepID=UPI001C4C3F86|nr:uncharacterized protein LOC121952328 isoform X3 [Plectropomus leopardus]